MRYIIGIYVFRRTTLQILTHIGLMSDLQLSLTVEMENKRRQITQTKMIQTAPKYAQEHWVSEASRFI